MGRYKFKYCFCDPWWFKPR